MSEYASLRDALEALRAAQDDYADTVQRFVTSTVEMFAAEDKIVSELRDDLHALSNRIESVARRVATPFDPPEAA